jgi:hypothetical protein
VIGGKRGALPRCLRRPAEPDIALMGFVLVNGVLGYLKMALPGSVGSWQLQSLAEKIAAGNLSSFDQTFPENMLGSREIVHAALVHGFGSVMLYGGVCVWALATASFVTFGARRITRWAAVESEKEALSVAQIASSQQEIPYEQVVIRYR